MYIDIHSHRPSQIADFQLVNLDNLSLLPPAGNYSVGLHPWRIHPAHLAADLDLVHQHAAHPSVWAIGEAGLDTKIAVPMSVQKTAFLPHIQLAEKYKKPLIIHCVGAHQEMIALKYQTKPLMPWVIHGFCKKQPIAQALLRAGCWLSIGAAVLHPQSPVCEVVATMPADKLLLETDDADVSIKAIYQRCAELRRMSVADFAEQIVNNVAQLLGANAPYIRKLL